MTLPSDELPINPQITPAWGVAGTIMLLTGLAYALIGIKNRWIHTFFSTAYLAALGITVLIIYVMPIPVSNALQGGYVAAIVVSACAVGAASTFFRELTEGFGCALGGFCLSMWLMCLTPGGIIQQAAGRTIFIASLTLVGFAFYFSRLTRDWALIVLIAFAGSTITVLGIDCLSRAGLKEFWAYTWHLNDNLFPLGADTYPVTKGIRVEQAAVIIIFLFGVISQIKLWRIIRERRGKRDAIIAEGQRNLQEEEENVGRQVEANTKRDRKEWERIYGDGTTVSCDASHVSGEYDAEKAARHSQIYSQTIELENMSESDPSQQGIDGLIAGEDEEGKVTVRVVEDDVPNGPIHPEYELDENAGAVRTSQRYSQQSMNSKRNSMPVAITPAPDVVPLPFTVPEDEENAARTQPSSVATFADEEDDDKQSKRRSAVKRFSRGSATLLRSLSQRSQRSQRSNRPNEPINESESTEELVSPRRQDDNGSLAATMDDESIGESRRSSLEGKRDPDAPSVMSGNSIPANLSQGHLPQSLSRVALSYRTNEWAKHLSHADAPDLDELDITKPVSPKLRVEKVRAVNLDELKQTAHSGIPPANMARSDSRTAHLSAALDCLTKTDKRRSVSSAVLPPPSPSDPQHSPKSPVHALRSASTAALTRSPIEPIAEEFTGFTPLPQDDAASIRSNTPAVARPPIPGVMSFNSPQTLLGQREMFLRSRSQGNLGTLHGSPSAVNVAGSDAGSVVDFPAYPAPTAIDGDDIPLSQRRSMMRSNSRLSLTGSVASLRNDIGYNGAENLSFNSHQPQRNSSVPAPAFREAQLANFRMSVSQDLRSGNPIMLSSTRDTPFASTNNLLGGRDHEIQRNMEMQRNIMLGQKEAEAQRKEIQRREREHSDRAFNDKMRSGDLMEAHREAMKKMQRSAK